MMKKILAVAIASAFAPAAFAATANVEIYGTAAMSVESVDGGSCVAGGGGNCITQPGLAGDNTDRRWRVGSNTSRIGFKGSEDLGGGLSAVWQIEQSLNLDAGGGNFATGRNNFAGLSSKSWGAVTLGLQDTPYKVATGRLDVFGGGHYMADYRTLFGGSTNGSVRATNSVMYVSPNMSGFSLRAMTAANEEAGTTGSAGLYSLSGTYSSGPLFATLAYEQTKWNTSAANTTIAGAGGNLIRTGGGSTAETKQKNWRAGVGYSFGNTRIGVGYEKADWDIKALTGTLQARDVYGTTVATDTTASVDRKAWYVGAEHKMGNTTLKAAYTKAGDLEANNTGATQYSLGASYNFSKRTEVYGLYTRVNNETNAAYSLGGNPTGGGGGTGIAAVDAAAAGQDPHGFSLGMIHRF